MQQAQSANNNLNTSLLISPDRCNLQNKSIRNVIIGNMNSFIRSLFFTKIIFTSKPRSGVSQSAAAYINSLQSFYGSNKLKKEVKEWTDEGGLNTDTQQSHSGEKTRSRKRQQLRFHPNITNSGLYYDAQNVSSKLVDI